MMVIDPARIEAAEKLYLEGKTSRQIQTELSREYGVTRRAVRRYLQRMHAKLAKLPKPSPEAARARVESLALRAYLAAEVGSEKFGSDAKAMVQAVKVLAEIDGLVGKRTMEHSGPGGGPIPVAGQAVVRVVQLPALESKVPGADR